MRRIIGLVAGATVLLGSVLSLAPSAANGATTAGTLSVLAGDGSQGFLGNGSPAPAAQFYDPSDEAVSGGTVYIADMKNCQVRQVVGGTVSVFAGGGGTDATCATGGGLGEQPPRERPRAGQRRHHRHADRCRRGRLGQCLHRGLHQLHRQ